MSTQLSAPHKVASNAIITISSSSWRWALPVRGSVELGKTGPKPLHAVLLCNQDGKIRSIFLHKKNQQISYAIPLAHRRFALVIRAQKRLASGGLCASDFEIMATVLEQRPTGAGFKAYRRGTHRTVDPAATLARLQPHLAGMGITRIANVTGLDRIGVPVVMVCRPNARSLAVSQGKGLTLDAAKASGVMEAIELYHAEHIELPLKLAQRPRSAAAATV